MKKKAIVYIDAYNWYHAIFKHNPQWKWLNVQKFFEVLRPDDDIVLIKFFSSYIKHDADALERQIRYFNALKKLPKFRLIEGVFQPRTVRCRGECRNQYAIQEEKKTDVNLAIEIVNDALKKECEHIIAVTGDSDIQPAIEWVVKNQPEIKITVLVPLLKNEQDVRRTDYYKTKGLKVDCGFLNLNGIPENQFPPLVKLGDGKFAAKPENWK